MMSSCFGESDRFGSFQVVLGSRYTRLKRSVPDRSRRGQREGQRDLGTPARIAGRLARGVFITWR